MERDLKVSHDHFVELVAENRNLRVGDVAKLADGSSLPGPLALEAKLIDAIGDKESARDWFAAELGLPAAEIAFCE